MGQGARNLSSFFAAAFLFFAAKVALSQAQTHPVRPARELQVADVSIPSSLGYILETHQAPPSKSKPSPIIIHIQDAHTNYEAQKNIAAILEQLVKEHDLSLIMVEGGEGDVSLRYLRRYGPPEHRKQVAEKYLRAGIISSEEYLDIISDFPMTIWGVERKELYQQNVEAFLAGESLWLGLQPALAAAREAALQLKPHLADPALVELEAKAQAFERQQLPLANYAEALQQAAASHRVRMEPYTELGRFLELHRVEQSIRLPEVQQEQQRLTEALSRHVSEAQLESLVNLAIEMKAKRVKPAAFYSELKRLADDAQLSLESSPQLAQYIRYVTQDRTIDSVRLAKQLDECSRELRRTLASTPESRTLSRILEEIDLIEKLATFRLSPEERRRFSALKTQTLARSWQEFLSAELARAKLPAPSFAGLAGIETRLATLERFYDVAGQRDTVLVRNAIAKLRESQEPIAVLITGGFHSPEITRMLKQEGVATIVMTPRVNHVTDERLYRAVLKYKSGHGSFEEVMAIASPRAPAQPKTTVQREEVAAR